MRPTFPALLATAFLALAGCRGDTHEAIADDCVGLMHEVVDVLEVVTDAETAAAAEKHLDALAKRAHRLNNRVKEVGKPDQATIDRLTTQIEERTKELAARMMRLMAKLVMYPDVQLALRRVAEQMPFRK